MLSLASATGCSSAVIGRRAAHEAREGRVGFEAFEGEGPAAAA